MQSYLNNVRKVQVKKKKSGKKNVMLLIILLNCRNFL